jgi:hypothetical protein
MQIPNWFKDIPLGESDIVDAHTFALISEQLKRVDLLIKGTMNVAGLISTRTDNPQIGIDASLCSSLTKDEITRISAKLPKMSYSHPIVVASQLELQRVMTLLSALRAGTPEMVAKAKGGLLDLLRNSLTDIWMGDDLKRATVTRSIFNSMLSALTRMCTKTLPESRRISFSLLLTSIERMWIVDWRLGHRVDLNVVKSKVNTSTVDASAKLDNTINSINMDNTRL